MNNEFKVYRISKNESFFTANLKVFFVLKGDIQITVDEKTFTLNQNDLLIVNPVTNYSVYSKSYNIVAEIKLEKSDGIFVLNGNGQSDNKHKELRSVIKDLIYQHTYKTHKGMSYTYSLLYKIQDILEQKYMIGNDTLLTTDEDDAKFKKIILHIYANYREDVNLNELADTFYMSPSTFSRFFKKKTGMYFADFISDLRCKKAAQLLSETDYSITKIAIDSGFSTPSTFNRVFKSIYAVTPNEFRNNNKTKALDINEEIKQKEIIESGIFDETSEDKCVINLDYENSKYSNYVNCWSKVINIGACRMLTIAPVQHHILFLKNELNFEYVRIWSIFSTKMTFCDGTKGCKYNFDKIDLVFDFLYNNNIKVFIDFGVKPNAITSSSGSVFYENEYIQFESKEAYEEAFLKLFNHFIKRYGFDVVSKWIVELSFDSRHYSRTPHYQDDNYNFLDVYKMIYSNLKSLVPSIKIGGFSSIFENDNVILYDFFTECKNQNYLPDFISFIMFPYGKNMELQDDKFEVKQMKEIKTILKSVGIENIPVYLTEFNNSISNRNLLNDSCYRATFIIHKIIELWDDISLISILMGTDWVSSYIDSIGVVTGSIGLVTKDEIKKPAFYALDFLNKLGPELIKKDSKYIVTRNTDGSFVILVHNFKKFCQSYYKTSEDVVISRMMDGIYEDDSVLDVNIIIQNLSPGNYTVRTECINSDYGSILDEWKKFDNSTDLSANDIHYLKEVCIPHVTLQRQFVENSNQDFSFNLEPNEIRLVRISKDKS